MEVTVKEMTMVTPCEETPRTSLWLSNNDLAVTAYHVSIVYFYKSNGSRDFFDTKVLREALSKVLVSFYPYAGRLGYDKNGRIEIVCNAEGVLFGEAETSSVMDDFVQDFSDGSKVPQLVPKFDKLCCYFFLSASRFTGDYFQMRRSFYRSYFAP
ncbi:Hydroxycinnamoyl CoA shikimate/quinate hydroxycinnamoyltransferase [Hibiscus syriacus]|uniref:Hydroxycinnamoyl CoA shikimate/quinate hydroxycinnamoyltransferase n=1 Tax=Hibiscus syriacus TaxID=106335 RepID=A0A6A2XZF7_HIBSY|nr:Hydroxycinnamoyl CoA shikimate/quinate hydroxycinnamoyltransferase [Hibiscus syriacus]